MNKNTLKTISLGIFQALTGVTSIIVVTTLLDLNLANTFLIAGICTLLVHLITKNKICITYGASGIYISSILYVSQQYGIEYVPLGVFASGLIVFLVGLVFLKTQQRVMKYFPKWLLSTAILLIGLNLLPIGSSMLSGNYAIGIITLLIVALIDLRGGKLTQWAMPIGILCGFIISLLTGNVDFSVLQSPVTLQLVPMKFHLGAIFTLMLCSLATIMESLGDIQAINNITGRDAFEEVGIGRITIANGLGNMLSGLGCSQGMTTYSECSNYVRMIKNYNPNIQIVAAITFIVLALTPLLTYVRLIPSWTIGGAVTYLFATMIVGSFQSIEVTHRRFVIISIMIALNFIPFVVMGVSISSTTVALIVGILLNALTQKRKELNKL